MNEVPSMSSIEELSARMDSAISITREIISRHGAERQPHPFNIRGSLYHLAHEIAPLARSEEIQTIRNWVNPAKGEVALDIGAGSGFLTREILKWTGSDVYAVDPSTTQLEALRQNAPEALTILGFPDDPAIRAKLPSRQIDFVTSLAAMHHVKDHKALFTNIGAVLRRGGRFVLGDVAAYSSVARHFDDTVASRSLTGHTAQWLSIDTLPYLIDRSPLTLRRAEIVPVRMRFSTKHQMGLFYKGLHAFDLPLADITNDIERVLGVDHEDGLLFVKWPLLFASFERI